MTLSKSPQLVRECEVFLRYLGAGSADAYVQRKYLGAHQQGLRFSARSRFDRFLVGFACLGPLFTKLADSYARLFAPASALRRKLILLAAILECCAFAQSFFSPRETGHLLGISLRLLGRGMGFVASLLLGAIVLLPAQLLLGSGPTGPTEER